MRLSYKSLGLGVVGAYIVIVLMVMGVLGGAGYPRLKNFEFYGVIVEGGSYDWATTVVDAPEVYDLGNGTVFLLFEGFSGGASGEEIGGMRSANYYSWSNISGLNPMGDLADSDGDGDTWSANDEACPRILYHNGMWILFWSSHISGYDWSIGVANSSLNSDWYNFTNIDNVQVLARGGGDSWDETCVFHPSSPINNGTHWFMFYSGRSASAVHGLGYAITSNASFPYGWTKMTVESPLWVTVQQPRPDIVKLNDTYYLMYVDGGLKYRTSSNLVDWSDSVSVSVKNGYGSGLSDVSLLVVDDYYGEYDGVFLYGCYPTSTIHSGYKDIVLLREIRQFPMWWEDEISLLLGFGGMVLFGISGLAVVYMFKHSGGNIENERKAIFVGFTLAMLGLVFIINMVS